MNENHPFASAVAGGAILLLLAFAQETSSKTSPVLQNRSGLAYRAGLAFRSADEYCESGWAENAPALYDSFPLDRCPSAGSKAAE